jgi:hypothetical protein
MQVSVDDKLMTHPTMTKLIRKFPGCVIIYTSKVMYVFLEDVYKDYLKFSYILRRVRPECSTLSCIDSNDANSRDAIHRFFLYLQSWSVTRRLYEPLDPPSNDTTSPTDDQNECSICLENFSKEPNMSSLCHHRFHVACLARWAEANPNCPLCRRTAY